jgi:von Willebrand factor type A domain
MRNHGLLLPAIAALLLPVAPARGDTLHAERSDAMAERAHHIDARIDHGHAELTVHRTLWNGGKRHDQATFKIDLPEEAVATGLRTLGIVDGKPTWFTADLMEAEAAAAKYTELTGIGGYYPKDPALLSWRSQRLLALQVFPVPPAQPKTIEYTLAIPAHYHGGLYHVTLPRVGTQALAATLSAAPANAADRVFVDGKPAGAEVALDRETRDLALSWPSAPQLAGGLGSVAVAPGKTVARFHVEAAAHLSRAPRGAYVVVVIDASRSIHPLYAAAGLAAARAYLGHLPDAHVEVLTFDREVHPRHGRFVTAAKASADLAKLTLDLRNGSRVDDALSRADALLAAAPAGAARRILAITDLATRSALTPEHVTPLLKSGAVLHVGVMEGGADASLARDDESPWAEVARATGGLVWKASAGDLADPAKMKKVYEEWARPVRIHHPSLAGLGSDSGLGMPETLDEGEGLEHLWISDGPVREVTLAGELWSSPVSLRLTPDDAEGRRWSALVFGSSLVYDLDEREQMVLAQRGHAVSPVTSLLAVEPGVRPSTEGLELTGIGEGGGGRGEGIGLGSFGTIGHGAGGFDPHAFLRDAVSAGLRTCGGAGRKATVELETTSAEVVDVVRVAIDGPPSAALASCLREAVWAIDLPAAFHAPWATWTVVSAST